MGQTLATAAKWTSAGEGPRGSLEYNPTNEVILNKFLEFSESFCSTYPELSKIEFKQALVWSSDLPPQNVSGLTEQGDGNFLSDKLVSDSPILSMRRQDEKFYEVSVRNFEGISLLVRGAGDKKMVETRLCLEANPDPVAKMLGDRFATVSGQEVDTSTTRFIEEVMRDSQHEQRGAAGDEDQQEQQQSSRDEKGNRMTEVKMLLTMQRFDTNTLQEALATMSNSIKLTPEDVEREMKLLCRYCGPEEDEHLLENLQYLENYDVRFNDGCRAMPWRQVHGEICYVVAKQHGEEPIFITASVHGYFVNKGYDKECKKLDHEIDGSYYRSITALLQEKSPGFAEKVSQQELFKVRQEKKQSRMVDLMPIDQADENAARDHDRHRGQQQEKKRGDSGKKQQDNKKKLEPSLKWKNLEIDEKRYNSDEDPREKTPRKKKNSQMKIYHSDGEDSFEESSSESEEEEETPDRRNEANSDLPSEYWQIQKLVKYLKSGNQTATLIALCAMRDFNLQQETCQLAIRDVGGLELLINLLDTESTNCKIGSLLILKEISKNPQIRRAIADLGGLQTMVHILKERALDLKCLAAETIANVAKFRRARRTVRQHGGIRKLVGLLDSTPACHCPQTGKSADQEKTVEVARCGALALWSLSKSTRNKQAMRKSGAIPLLAKLLKSQHEDMLIPVVGTLQECATESSYRLAIRTEGMVEDLVKNLKSQNQELQMHCARAIFKCAEEKETRDLVRQYGGLDPLVALLEITENKELLAAATGAIWKCSISPENVQRFQELKAIEMLVGLLNDQPEEVLVNVVGALAELAQDPPNRHAIRKAGGIPPLVNLLTGTNQALLVNVTKAVGQCAEEPDNMAVIDKLDGVRLLWSLLKNPNPEVQASAAWAICPCIENAKDAGEMVRSFVGGLELIVMLLKSDDLEVLASVCAAIANIANDEENLAVITDHGVVPMLARLTGTNDDKLRRHLAEAIARCCNWGNNRVAFGDGGAVAPLVRYLKSDDKAVHRSTARALHQLSKDPRNCITMHEADVVKPLMEMVGSEDDVLQEAAAGCLGNIRRLALANEKAHNK